MLLDVKVLSIPSKNLSNCSNLAFSSTGDLIGDEVGVVGVPSDLYQFKTLSKNLQLNKLLCSVFTPTSTFSIFCIVSSLNEW